eukprot:268058-Rhodomonas_salina.1
MEITVGRLAGSTTDGVSYNPDRSLVSTVGNYPRTGSVDVTVLGSGFGVSSLTAVVRWDGSACEATGWLSDTTVRCKIPRTTSDAAVVQAVTSARMVGTVKSPFLFSVDLSPVSSVSPTNLVSTGSVSVSVFGVGFGFLSSSPGARVAGSGCEATLWVSDSALNCRHEAVRGQNLITTATAGRLLATADSEFFQISADQVQASGVFPANSLSTGSSIVTLLGSNLGSTAFSDQARAGTTACEATVWISVSSTKCRTGSSLSGTLTFAITSKLRTGSVTAALSFDRAQISSIVRSNVAMPGSMGLTIQGASVGSVGYTPYAGVGGTSCEASIWLSTSAMVCMGTHGVGKTYKMAVTVGRHLGSCSDIISYDFDTVVSSSAGNKAASGSMSVTVLGQSLGLWDQTPTIRWGATMSEATTWTSDSSLICKTAAAQLALVPVAVTCAQTLHTGTGTITIDAAHLSRTLRANVGSQGSISITVIGSAIGTVDAS